MQTVHLREVDSRLDNRIPIGIQIAHGVDHLVAETGHRVYCVRLVLVDALHNTRNDESSRSREYTRRRVNTKSTLKRAKSTRGNIAEFVVKGTGSARHTVDNTVDDVASYGTRVRCESIGHASQTVLDEIDDGLNQLVDRGLKLRSLLIDCISKSIDERNDSIPCGVDDDQ